MTPGPITLTGPYTSITLDLASGSLSSARGRFEPTSALGPDVLAAPGITWRTVTGLADEVTQNRVDMLRTTATEAEVCLTELRDGVPWSTTRWHLELVDRGVRVTTKHRVERDLRASAVLLDVACPHWMLLGLFERGVVQQVCAGQVVLASRDPLRVFCSIDHERGALALVPHVLPEQVLLVRDEPAGSVGLRLVALGTMPDEDVWADLGWSAQQEVRAGDTFELSFTLFVNDLPFPTHAVDAAQLADTTDARTHFTALYASSAAALGGYLVPGSTYPTIAAPTRTYWTLHTFFDPDAWASVCALAASGDPYLVREARRILDRARSGLTQEGQVPHHFDVEEPVYVAISGAPQTGPNLFWVLAALDYVAVTGDTTWLRSVWADGLVPAMRWVTSFFDPGRDLLCVTGPLWIDVFRRSGYTFDTNVTTAHVLRRMADAATYLGDLVGAAGFTTLADRITHGLDALWHDDHFLTERSPGWDTARDMLDADNYLAVAFSVVEAERATALLDRLDRVPSMHPGGKGTWVSGVPYGPEDCYGENTGDSATAMARLWWADLSARRATGDAETFTALYEAVRADLLDHTWMTERYDEHGRMVRAPGYHEYPEVLMTMLREGLYGLTITLTAVELRPMRPGSFSVRIGAAEVVRTPELVRLQVPGDGPRDHRVWDLVAGGQYLLDDDLGTHGALVADAQGRVEFTADAGAPHTLRPR